MKYGPVCLVNSLKNAMESKITGVGHYVPKMVIANRVLEMCANTSDEWIVNNTGIRERHSVMTSGEKASDLGVAAAKQAIFMSGVTKSEIGMVICATATPDAKAPSTACIIKKALDLTNATAMDVSAVCSGFLYGLAIAQQFIPVYENILIIGTDVFSTITDWVRRDCIFFGDGAGAVVLSRSPECGFKKIIIHSDSMDNEGFRCEHGKTFDMNTKLVYKSAMRLVPEVISEVLNTAGMKIEDIDYMVPHQPSKRLLLDIALTIGMPEEKVLMNMDKYANTSAGTIPILLSERWVKFRKGDKILFAAIGSGWTYGAAIYEV